MQEIHMKKRIGIIAAIIIGIVAIGFATVMVLSKVESTRNQDDSSKNQDDSSDPEPLEDGVDRQLNNQAAAIEAEANELLESDPVEAHKKYEEAAKAYTEAGNLNKAGDMADNAQTAKSLTPVSTPEEGEPVVTPMGPLNE